MPLDVRITFAYNLLIETSIRYSFIWVPIPLGIHKQILKTKTFSKYLLVVVSFVDSKQSYQKFNFYELKSTLFLACGQDKIGD